MNVNNPIQVSLTPPPRAASESSSASNAAAADPNADMLALVAVMRQEMQDMRQQMAQMNRGNSRRSVSEALHTAHGEKGGEYSASASVQQPPVLQHRRESMGNPSSAFTPGTVATPRPAAARRYGAVVAPRMDSLDEGKEEASRLGSPVEAATASVQEQRTTGCRCSTSACTM